MKVSAILAVGKDYEIGLNSGLPWTCSGDMKHFKNLTRGHCVLMGYNTYISIGKPLPNRTNIVITSKDTAIDGCIVCHSIEEGISYANKQNEDELFIIGGVSIYKYCSEQKLLDRVYLTHIIY